MDYTMSTKLRLHVHPINFYLYKFFGAFPFRKVHCQFSNFALVHMILGYTFMIV